ncbi:MAG: hypothetical protein AAGI25_03190 [Bacteroidota bacterium]
MEFIEYLKSKKIDPEKYRNGYPEQYRAWETLFNEVHPNSFTQQKLFLLNKTRREFPFKETITEKKPSSKAVMRPKVKPFKPKME